MLERLSKDSPQVRAVLERVDDADKRLLSSVPPAPRPRVVPSAEAPGATEERAMA